jgi:glycosyltransferase involved in cell wall biosynthesis
MTGRPRSIALYTPGWPPGAVPNGIVTYVGHLRAAFEPLGVTTLVLTPHIVGGFAGGSPPAAAAVDITQIRTPPVRRLLERALNRIPRYHAIGLRLGWSIAQAAAIGVDRPDLLEMEETFGAAWYAQQALEIPIVVRLHGPAFLNMVALGEPEDDHLRRIDRAERRCIAEAAGVTAPSRDVLERVRNRYEIPLAEAQVIPNPAPTVPRERRWRLDESDGRTILFVGRFDRHKAGDIILDAFREVATALPEARLVFVGPDRGLRDETGNVHSLPAYLDAHMPAAVRARLEVTGPLGGEQIAALRRRSFLTVVPSRYENFPLALVESLAYGCPTVASDAGGIPEILLRDQTGLLARTGDRADLAANILALFRDPQRAAALGGRAADDIAARLNPDAIARATLAYYEDVLQKRRPRRRGASLAGAAYALTGLGG